VKSAAMNEVEESPYTGNKIYYRHPGRNTSKFGMTVIYINSLKSKGWQKVIPEITAMS